MEDYLFKLLVTIVSVVITTLSTFLINYLNEKMSSEKINTCTKLACEIVKSIEQFNPQLDANNKKNLATQKLVELANNKITYEQPDILIEAAVYELKKALKN